MRANTLFIIIITVLILTAAVLVYSRYRSGPTILETSKNEDTQSITRQQPGIPSELEAVRSLPRNASEEEAFQYRDRIRGFAQEGNAIEINEGCVISPLNLIVALEDSITINNKDNIAHTLSRLDGGGEITVPPSDSTTLRIADFIEGKADGMDERGGTALLSCDSFVSGVFSIRP